MQNLWQFLTRHFHWLLFLVLEGICGFMLFRYNSYQGSVWLSSANAVAGQVYEWRSAVEQFFSLTERNQQLEQLNLQQSLELNQLRQTLDSLHGDTTSMQRLGQQGLAPSQLIPARVVANSVDRRDNLLTINRGRADGVQPDMGVVCGSGLVGVVYLASQHYAVVIPVLNERSRISCAVRHRGYFGYLTWTGGDPQVAYVEDIPRHAKVRKGDWIETSGYSSIFPPGLNVGQIVAVYNSDDGLSYRLKVALATDFSRLRDVFVMQGVDHDERVQLTAAARDSLMMNRTHH